MTDAQPEKLVEQVDRDAALSAASASLGERIDLAAIRTGGQDDHPLVQAFARHRIQSAEAAAGRAWQPIETAPRDGTPILAIWFGWDASGRGGSESHDVVFRAGTMWMSRSCEPVPEPTHWQPLPEPPAIRAISPSSIGRGR